VLRQVEVDIPSGTNSLVLGVLSDPESSEKHKQHNYDDNDDFNMLGFQRKISIGILDRLE